MARERRGFIVTQVWAEIAYADHTGQQRKITKRNRASVWQTSKNLKDAEKQMRKIEQAKSIIRDTIAELKQSGGRIPRDLSTLESWRESAIQTTRVDAATLFGWLHRAPTREKRLKRF